MIYWIYFHVLSTKQKINLFICLLLSMIDAIKILVNKILILDKQVLLNYFLASIITIDIKLLFIENHYISLPLIDNNIK